MKLEGLVPLNTGPWQRAWCTCLSLSLSLSQARNIIGKAFCLCNSYFKALTKIWIVPQGTGQKEEWGCFCMLLAQRAYKGWGCGSGLSPSHGMDELRLWAVLGSQGSCCWFGHGDTSLGRRMQCALRGISCWQEGSLEGAICVLLMSCMELGLWRSAGRVHFIWSHSEKPPCSAVLPWSTGVPPNRGALLQGTLSVTAITAKQLSSNEDLVVTELHSRPVSLRRYKSRTSDGWAWGDPCRWVFGFPLGLD